MRKLIYSINISLDGCCDVDEYVIVVHPVLVGEGLKFVEATPLKSGYVALRCLGAGAQATGN